MSSEQPSLLCEAEKLAMPEFLGTNDFFGVRLYRPVIEYLGGAIDHSSGADLGGSMEQELLTQRQTQILNLVQQDPKISYGEMAAQIGINELAIKKHLNHLKDAGWLERVGGTRGYWMIKKESGGDV